MTPLSPFFLVRINKAEQNSKRAVLFSRTIVYFGAVLVENDGNGCLIKEVTAGSPANNVSFTHGDVIVKMARTDTPDLRAFSQVLNAHKPGDTVEVHYRSNLHPEFIVSKMVTLGEIEFKVDSNQYFNDFKYNLQYGVILAISSEAATAMPSAQIGDFLLFNHLVEHKPRETGDKAYADTHLVGFADDSSGDELRIVTCPADPSDPANEVLGVVKQDNGVYIIPHPNFIFCDPVFNPSGFQMQNGIWSPLHWRMTMDEMVAKQESLLAQINALNAMGVLQQKETEENYRRLEEVRKELDGLYAEKEKLAQIMRQKHLIETTVQFFNPKTAESIGVVLRPGDKLAMDQYSFYPLEVHNNKWLLARASQVEYAVTS